jgi:hypothetical protein
MVDETNQQQDLLKSQDELRNGCFFDTNGGLAKYLVL